MFSLNEWIAPIAVQVERQCLIYQFIKEWDLNWANQAGCQYIPSSENSQINCVSQYTLLVPQLHDR